MSAVFSRFTCFFACLLLPFAAAADSVRDGSFLWCAARDGAPVSYLAGTVHVGKDGNRLPPLFQAALARSRVLVVENTGILPPSYRRRYPAEQQLIASMLHADEPLSATLGAKRMARVRSFVQPGSHAAAASVLQPESKTAPGVAGFFFSLLLLPEGYGYGNGIDVLMAGEARRLDKEFLALESEADVLKLLHRLPAGKVGRLLDAQMDEAQEGRREIHAILDAYYGGRVRQLLRLLDPKRDNHLSRRLSTADRAFWRHHSAEEMLAGRNRIWLERLDILLPQESHTVAVGTAHLFGRDGLLQSLARRGWRVRQVLDDKDLSCGQPEI